MDSFGDYLVEYAVRLSLSILENAWDTVMAKMWLAAVLGGLITFVVFVLGTNGGVWGAVKQAQVRRAMGLVALRSIHLATFLLAILSSIDTFTLCDHLLKHKRMIRSTKTYVKDEPEGLHTPQKSTCLGIVASATAKGLRCRRSVKRDSSSVEDCYCDKHREQGYARLEIWAATGAG